ncbi:MAG: hypothetical protein ACOYM2_14705 [Rectinemataceae bacterium]
MKSITIHGIDVELEGKIIEKTRQLGLSQNKTVISLLRSTLQADTKASRRQSFSELFGKWTAQDKETFDEQVRQFEVVDESDWQASNEDRA